MSAFRLHEQLAADTHLVVQLELSDLLLMNDQRFPWLILVPRIAGARELHKLDNPRRLKLNDEIQRVSDVMDELFDPFKLNIAALGNMVAQLHVHIIARFEKDAAWPAPVWGNGTPQPYAVNSAQALIQRIANSLDR